MDLPRVTDILKEAGLIDTTWLTEYGRERGTAVHLACQFYDEGTLDYASVSPEIEGYLRAYDAWKRESGIQEFEWIEGPLQDPQGKYRGTPDRILVTRPRKLIDLKSGIPMDWHALQLAAYVTMLDDPYSYERLGLYLSVDGTYSVRVFPKSEYNSDLNVFLSCLNIVNWKRGKSNGRKQAT
jgi:hypothetical protein